MKPLDLGHCLDDIMNDKGKSALRVAFVVPSFPVISQTFIINQVADLLDRSVEVDIFAFEAGDRDHITARYAEHRMAERTTYLTLPVSRLRRCWLAIPRLLRLCFFHPAVLLRVCNVFKHGKEAWSLRLLFQVAPFLGREFDAVHCHFGDAAVRYLKIKDALRSRTPLVTTFYGYDVSVLFQREPPDFYDRLKAEGALFLVMSENMKQRIISRGFPEEKIMVHPVNIQVARYPFRERVPDPARPVEIVFVGRQVEKKGVDDLLRALALVRQRSAREFCCSLVGGGPLETQHRALCRSLGLEDVVRFKGSMNNEEMLELLLGMHFMVQPSKTARDGDME